MGIVRAALSIVVQFHLPMPTAATDHRQSCNNNYR